MVLGEYCYSFKLCHPWGRPVKFYVVITSCYFLFANTISSFPCINVFYHRRKVLFYTGNFACQCPIGSPFQYNRVDLSKEVGTCTCWKYFSLVNLVSFFYDDS